MSCRKQIALVLIGMSLVVGAHADAAPTVFSDDTFDDADWDLTVFTFVAGGSTTASQIASGGNPGSYRQITVTLNPPISDPAAVAGFHSQIGSIYDPGVDGAVARIDYFEHSLLSTGFGNGQTSGAAIRQDGKVYVMSPGIFTPDFDWVSKQRDNLQAVDFAEVLTTGIVQGGKVTWRDEASHPDFSATGAPFEVGFRRSNRATAGFPDAISLVGGIDNWVFSITPVPEPSSLAIAMLGVAVFVRTAFLRLQPSR